MPYGQPQLVRGVACTTLLSAILLLGSSCDGDGVTDPSDPVVVGTYAGNSFWTFSAQGALPGSGGPVSFSCAGRIAIERQNGRRLTGTSVYESAPQLPCFDLTLSGSGTVASSGAFEWSDGMRTFHERVSAQLGCTLITAPSSYTGFISGESLTASATSTMNCPAGQATLTITGQGQRRR